MSERIEVTRCGNCPKYRPFRCKRLNMTMYESDPPCNWAMKQKNPAMSGVSFSRLTPSRP